MNQVREIEEFIRAKEKIIRTQLLKKLLETLLKNIRMIFVISKWKQKDIDFGINAKEKLILIFEDYKHIEEYMSSNKTIYWDIIQKLLKKQSEYDFIQSSITITSLIKAPFAILIDENIDSDGQVKQNTFKAIKDWFAGRLKTVQKELDLALND